MLTQIGEIAPRVLVFGLVIWGAVNWAALGVELGGRTLRANGHIANCEKGFGETVASAAREEIGGIPAPFADPQKRMAADALRSMNNSPFGELMNSLGGAYGVGLDTAISAYEEQERTARAAYKRAVEEVKKRTASRLGKAGEYCGCVAAEAISAAQTEFAIYSGTLTLVRPAKIRDLDALMAGTSARNVCAHLAR